MRQLDLGAAQNVTMEPAKIVNTQLIDIDYVVDHGNKVEALIGVQGSDQKKTVVLWDENTTPSYTTIGQWTDTDVDNRIPEVI